MKKIGVLYGGESEFPNALVDKLNESSTKTYSTEAVTVFESRADADAEYAVIVDRVSYAVPYYIGYLKQAAVKGTAVLNNPLLPGVYDEFYRNAAAAALKLNLPKTVLLPAKSQAPYTDESFYRNMGYPLDWEQIFEHVGFPAVFMNANGNKNMGFHVVYNRHEFFDAYNRSGAQQMMLQEFVEFDEFYHVYTVGPKTAFCMRVEPHSMRVLTEDKPTKKLETELKTSALKVSEYFGFDFNAVEFAVKDGTAYAVSLYTPSPQASEEFMGTENFEAYVNESAKFVVDRAKAQKASADNLTWNQTAAKPAPARKTAATKKTAAKTTASTTKTTTKKTAAKKTATKKTSK